MEKNLAVSHNTFFFNPSCVFFLILFLYLLFREMGREGEREGNINVWLLLERPCNPAMGRDWEWNQQPFGSQACTPSTEPHQPGLKLALFNI